MIDVHATPIRVMIVDDHPIVRSSLRSLLSNHGDLILCGEADSATAAIETVRELRPDVLLLDIRMPGVSGLDALRELGHNAPATKNLMLSSWEKDEYLTRSPQAGAHGYIVKRASDETMVTSVRAAHRGERVLSPVMVERLVCQVATTSRERNQHALGPSNDDVRMLQLIANGAGKAGR